MGIVHKLYQFYKTSDKKNTELMDFLKNPKNKKSIIDLNEDNKTILDLACEEGDYPLVKSLLDLDAYRDMPKVHKLYLLYKTSAHKNTDIFVFLRNPANKELIESLNEDEQTILHLAAYDDEWEIVYLLIEQEADVNKRDRFNRTALNYCIDCIPEAQINIPLVRLLIARGANINEADIRGFTSLHYAVLNGNLLKVSKLISLGADIDQMTNNLESPLKIALTRDIPNKARILQLLFNKADIISQDFVGRNGNNIVPPPGLTNGVVVIGSTLWSPALRTLVPITRAIPGFANAITDVAEFKQAAEAAEQEFNELSKTDITAKRRYNYKAIEIITRNKQDPALQALHALAAELAGRTESRVASLKDNTGRTLAKLCIFSKYEARIKLEQDIAKYPPDIQDIIEKEIHAMVVEKSTRIQKS